MDLLSFLLFAGICMISGWIGGFMARFLVDIRAVVAVEHKLLNLEKKIYSIDAVDKRSEKADRMSAAIAEAAIALKEGKEPMQIAKEVGMKYPEIALDLFKKFQKGGFGL